METACVVMLTVALTNLYGLIAVGDGPSVDTVCLWARPTIHLAQRGKAAALGGRTSRGRAANRALGGAQWDVLIPVTCAGTTQIGRKD